MNTLRPAVDFITETGAVAVICLGGYKVLQGQLSAGTFVIFFPYLQMMYGPITGLTRFYNQVQRAIASTERVFEALDTPVELQDAPDAGHCRWYRDLWNSNMYTLCTGRTKRC